jgi:flagellar motor switch protein FliN/FliY
MTAVTGRAIELLDAAGAAAATTLPAGETLTAHPTAIEELTLVGAVVVPFAGSASGELALLVDAELTNAMKDATIGEVDLALALAPTLEAVAAAIGPVALGAPQALDPRVALARITAHADVAAIALRTAADDTRAAIVLGVDATVENDAIPSLMTAGGPALDRLDLLRGVEMAASVELGRSTMTVNELLSLRNGSVIELDRAAGESADLFVNGRLIARGEVVVVDENYALRITQIATEDGH